MNAKPQFLLVNPKVLPDVFEKVIEAKRLLASGKVKTSSEASKNAGISRSVFYKYKDHVFPYEDRAGNRIITLGLRLSDEPGVLSSVLTELYRNGANLLTVNQNIPNDGIANVTVSVIIGDSVAGVEEMIEALSTIHGVIESKTI